jgi:RHS repeat-associated protein
VTVSDKKIGFDFDGNGEVDYYGADVVSANDYYPFGMGMVGRKFDAGSYRYGFNGQENDNEVKGEGNQQDYGMRIYDPRLGRFLSVDPLDIEYPWYSPYHYAGNSPVLNIDVDGAEPLNAWFVWAAKKGTTLKTASTNTASSSTPKHAGIDYSGAKIAKAAYVKTGSKALDLVANSKEIGVNITANLWNGTVDAAQDVSNLAFSADGRKEVIDRYSQGIINLATQSGELSTKLQSGEVTIGGMASGGWNYLGTPEGVESAGTFLAGLAIPNGIKGIDKPLRGSTALSGLSRLEKSLVSEANSILNSKKFEIIKNAFEKGTSAEVKIGGRLIQYDPNWTYSQAMTLHESNGFLLGPKAFVSSEETGKSLIHELFRLRTQKGIAVGVDNKRELTDGASNTADKLSQHLNQ